MKMVGWFKDVVCRLDTVHFAVAGVLHVFILVLVVVKVRNCKLKRRVRATGLKSMP